MIRIATLAAFATIALVLPSEARAETSRSIDAPSFTSARFESALNVDIVVGGPQSIAITAANGDSLDDVHWSVVGGELRVWTERDFWDVVSLRDRQVSVTVVVPSLDGLAASSATHVSAKGLTGNNIRIEASSAALVAVDDVDAVRMGIEATSAGQVFVTGHCETINVSATSAALVNARGLECVDGHIEASSASQTVLYATGDVTADVSATAEVVVIGDPDHVDDTVSTGGDVIVMN